MIPEPRVAAVVRESTSELELDLVKHPSIESEVANLFELDLVAGFRLAVHPIEHSLVHLNNLSADTRAKYSVNSLPTSIKITRVNLKLLLRCINQRTVESSLKIKSIGTKSLFKITLVLRILDSVYYSGPPPTQRYTDFLIHSTWRLASRV